MCFIVFGTPVSYPGRSGHFNPPEIMKAARNFSPESRSDILRRNYRVNRATSDFIAYDGILSETANK